MFGECSGERTVAVLTVLILCPPEGRLLDLVRIFEMSWWSMVGAAAAAAAVLLRVKAGGRFGPRETQNAAAEA